MGKKFIKAPLSIQRFNEIAPILALPPQPVVMCWGSWLDVSMYCSKNDDSMQLIVKSFDCCESSSMKIVKDSISETLAGNMAHI